MSAINTPRLALRKESDNETIDQFAPNWPILDKFAGGLLVAPGVTPADSELFDGCIVSEGANGKSWIAIKNPSTGAFTKKWLTYPWICCAYNSNIPVGSAANPGVLTQYGLGALDTPRCVNAGAEALSGGNIIPPIPGIYQAQFHTRWETNDTADVFKSAGLMLNNTNIQAWSSDIRHRNNSLVTNAGSLLFAVKGTTPYPVGIMLAQNTGGVRNCTYVVDVTLLSPL